MTYRYDLMRAPFNGILEAGWVTFGLVAAIRVFDAGETVKALIPAAGPAGFLLAPVTLALLGRTNRRIGDVAFWICSVSAVLLAVAALAPTLAIFVTALVMGQIAVNQQVPLVVEMYSRNYPATGRGARLSSAIVASGLVGALFAWGGGRLLDQDISHYPLIFAFMALAALSGGVMFRRIPTGPLREEARAPFFENVSLAWRDRLFGWILLSWMFMGLGNLITIPLRVEYLANPDYGLNASNTQIALITVVIPAAARIASTKFWGYCFDRFDFTWMRTVINILFLLGMVFFFTTKNLWVICFGTALIGLALGGGNITWNLWVTKIAPPGQVSAYMSVHTALTGVRGLVAPFIGFKLIGLFGPVVMVAVSGALIVISSVMFTSGREELRAREAAGS